MTTIDILLGVATWYLTPYVGQPLYCGGVYDTTHEWIALPMSADWQCGDLVVLWFEGSDASEHDIVMARVLDTGPFGAHCVIRHPVRPDCGRRACAFVAYVAAGGQERGGSCRECDADV